MIEQVQNKAKRFNNSGRIADSSYLTAGKVLYYRFLLALYRKMGCYLDLAFANSSWTYNHLAKLWKFPGFRLVKLYGRGIF